MSELTNLYGPIKLLVLVLAALGIIMGFRRQGIKIYKHVIIMLFLGPFLVSFFNQLPIWLAVFGALIIIGFIFRVAIGEDAWGQFFGAILYDVLWRLPLQVLGTIGRWIGSLFVRQR